MQSRVLVTIVAWLVVHSSPVMATAYDYCSLKQVPVEKLAKNPETGEFVKTGDAAIPRALRGQRTSSSSSDSLEEEPAVMLQAIGVTRRNTQEKNTTGWLEFGVRQCVCSDNVVIEDVYCPIKSSHCGIPLYANETDSAPICVTISNMESFSKSVLLGTLVSLGLMVFVLALTERGRGVFHCCASCCLPDWQLRMADRIIVESPGRARRILLSTGARRRAEMEGIPLAAILEDPSFFTSKEKCRRPTQLKLKTCVYHADGDNGDIIASEDETGEVSCVICFSGIDDGDRVGALNCKHIFHVDCLKSWLVRRNTCPLCQQPEAAQPLYDEDAMHSPASGLGDAIHQQGSTEGESETTDSYSGDSQVNQSTDESDPTDIFSRGSQANHSTDDSEATDVDTASRDSPDNTSTDDGEATDEDSALRDSPADESSDNNETTDSASDFASEDPQHPNSTADDMCDPVEQSEQAESML